MVNSREVKKRLQTILQGAFSGPPTPLKDIPTRTGNIRKLRDPTLTPAALPTEKPRRLKSKVRASEVDDR